MNEDEDLSLWLVLVVYLVSGLSFDVDGHADSQSQAA